MSESTQPLHTSVKIQNWLGFCVSIFCFFPQQYSLCLHLTTYLGRGEYKIRIPRKDDSEARTRWSILSSFRRYEISSKKEMLEKTRYELSIRTNTDAGAHNVKSVHRHNYLNVTSAHRRLYICQKYFYEWFSFDVCNWIPRNGDCQVRCVETADWSVWTEKTQTQYVRVGVCVIGRTRPFLCAAISDWWKYFRENVFGYFPKYINRMSLQYLVAESHNVHAQNV